MWACNRTNSTGLETISSLAEQRAFVRDLENYCTTDVSERIDDEEENWDFKGTVTVEEVDTSGARNKLRAMEHAHEHGGGAVPTTIVKTTEWACECVLQKRRNATLSNRYTDKKVKLAEARAAGSTMCGQLEAAKSQITAPEIQLANAEFALKKLANKTFRTEADLQA